MDRSWIGPIAASSLVVVGVVGWWFSGAPSAARPEGREVREIEREVAPPVPSERLLTVTPIATDRPAAPAGAPNVVLVIVNAWRRDQLSAYGGPPTPSPWLAGFAAKGARFDDVVAAAPWARPSDAALLTGRDPTRIGMNDPGDGGDRRVLAPAVDTLAERLAKRGWWTLGVTANFNLNARFGFQQGFDVYRDAQMASFVPPSRLDGAEQVRIALELLDKPPEGAAGRPGLLMLAMADAHKPFQIPLSEYEPFDGPEHEVAPYRAALRRIDDALAALDAGLSARGWTAENTVWMLVADHGEGLSMPEHHGRQHGRLLYDSAVRVPWLVRGPGVGAGVVVEGLAAHVDLMPTLLGLAGAWAPEATVQGSDWSALLAQGGRTTRSEAFTETWYMESNRAAVWTTSMACQKNWGPPPEDRFRTACYDRAKDADFKKAREDEALMDRLVAWRAEVLAEGLEFRSNAP